MKKGFADPDTGERMFRYSKHMKGCMMFRRNLNMTPQTVSSSSRFGSPCSACLVFAVMQGIHDNYGIMLPGIISRSGINYASVSFVIAVGQILYGATQPFFGMLAIKKSNAFVMFLGILLMAAGLIGDRKSVV